MKDLKNVVHLENIIYNEDYDRIGKSLKYNEFIKVKSLLYFCKFIYFREDKQTIIYESNSGIRETTMDNITILDRKTVVDYFTDELNKNIEIIKNIRKKYKESKTNLKYVKRGKYVITKKVIKLKDKKESINTLIKFNDANKILIDANLANQLSTCANNLKKYENNLDIFNYGVHRLNSYIDSLKRSLAESISKAKLYKKYIKECINNE